MKRLFVAIDFHFGDEFCAYVQNIRMKMSKLDKTTWVQPHLLHLTLKFLGETPEYKIPQIEQIVKAQTAPFAPFECQIARLGVFGSRSHPNVLWIGADGGILLSKHHWRHWAINPITGTLFPILPWDVFIVWTTKKCFGMP